MTVDVLYTNSSVTNIGATTFGVYPQYSIVIIEGMVNSTSPNSTVVLAKGTSAMGGCAWGTYYGRRWYYYDSDGTLRCDASSENNVIPTIIYGVK